MAFLKRSAVRLGRWPRSAAVPFSQRTQRNTAQMWVPVIRGSYRGFSSGFDPYRTLGLSRDASDDEIKRAYRENALKWHPDKHPDDTREEAQKRFADASNAYDILKDPQSRQEFDMTGQVGGGGGQRPGGFHRMSPEAMQELFQQLLMQEQMQRMQHGPGLGCRGSGRRRGELRVDQEVRIKPNAQSIHSASRKSNIDSENDERRARYAGKIGTISKVDPEDQSVKVRVMVSPGRADELWFGGGGVWDPHDLEVDQEVQISPSESIIVSASREAGIDAENDARRARCAGKLGTVVKIDSIDMSAKIRVIVKAGRADEVWFGAGAFEPLTQELARAHEPQPWAQTRTPDMRGFSTF